MHRGILAVLALLVVLAPGVANAWWKDEWSFRKKITIDTGPKGVALDSDPGRMPVLIRLHDGNFKFPEAKEDGSDLRFLAADDKTPLNYHIEKFDQLLGVGIVWVDVPAVRAGGTTEIWMYYGNQKATPAVNSAGTFGPEHTLVYHFAGKGTPPTDQTSYKNDAQTAASPSDGALIGVGLKLDGQNPIVLPDSPSLAIAEGGAFTLSLWLKPAEDQANGVIYSRRDGDFALVLGLEMGVPVVTVVNSAGSMRSRWSMRKSLSTSAPAGGDLPDTVEPAGWHHLALAAADGVVTLYVDGVPRGLVEERLPALTGRATLGGDPTQGAPGFVGEVDELQLSKVARSASFIAASVASQGPTAKLVVYGEDEANGSWDTGYFGVIIKSVTFDGWVVIGLCGVLAVASWFVMYNKTVMIGRMARGNAVFLAQFRKVGRDLTLLDEPDESKAPLLKGLKPNDRRALQYSSLYKIYLLGSEEVRTRFEGDGGDVGNRVLAPQSISAIRAVLDSGMVREMQRLNRMMVVLTIAISGGPFLGLLGTVVGVMITFGAIALAGDVNVNSIAPGIAAALVATVAGLGVAIPALFGYNYLVIRIKECSADMSVFVDEFATRLAEFYRARRIVALDRAAE